MFYVYLNRDASAPAAKVETIGQAAKWVTDYADPSRCLVFDEDAHLKFLAKREAKVTRPARLSELMAENHCSRAWAYELYRREKSGLPREVTYRGPKLDVGSLEAKIADLEAQLDKYRQRLTALREAGRDK